MRNLINFLIKYNHWFVFLLLELVCFIIMFRFNRYQASVYFTSVNSIASYVYDMTSSVNSYFGLRSANEKLLDCNIGLQAENSYLKTLLSEILADSIISVPEQYETIDASVINNSINKNDNYLTLNKGRLDGIEPDMGIVGPGGVAAIVYIVGDRRSLAISLLNSKTTISCKIKGSGYFGNLKWNGGDSQTAYLYDLPNHAEVSLGDTVVTSGYSSVFPEGILVGRVVTKEDSRDGLSFIIGVKLSTDFGKLSNVKAIRNKMKEEQIKLEEAVGK